MKEKATRRKQMKESLLLTPDRETCESLPFTARDSRAVFKVPLWEVYYLAAIN